MNRVILLFTLVLVMTSTLTGYGMWFQNLRTNVYVKTGDPSWSIDSYLVFVLHHCYCNCHCGCDHFHELHHNNEVSITNNNRSLTISINFTNCHHHYGNAIVWAGMVIENTGNIPIKINGINLSVIGDYDSVIEDYYMYGPYTEEEFNSTCAWNNIDPDNLPIPNSTNTLLLDPGEKGIIWLYILIVGGEDQILINIEPTPSPWNK